MEYAVPLEATVDAVRQVRAGWSTGWACRSRFPVEVRAVAGDDIALSPASGRDSGYIAVHVYRGTPFEAYFRGVEAIMADLGGRPHWGKLHFRTADDLAPAYPRWDRVPGGPQRNSTRPESSRPPPSAGSSGRRR